MTRPKRDKPLEEELTAMLAPKFPGLTVEVAHSDRWKRTCATFRWPGFATLLSEERFHRLATAIPASFREKRMVRFVWVELASGEDIDSYLKLPRSDEVADREATIYAGLVQAKFFEALAKAMGAAPGTTCRGDFGQVEAILKARKYSASKVRDAKLVFIRRAAYCDCQVIQTVQPELATLHVGAA